MITVIMEKIDVCLPVRHINSNFFSLGQVIEDRDKERKKASDLMSRLRRLEKESQEVHC